MPHHSFEIIHTDGCVHASKLLAYLSGRHDVTVVSTLVTANQPAPTKFAGSPTILIDGNNPFEGELAEAPACSLHPPTISQIDAYLSQTSGRRYNGGPPNAATGAAPG